MERSLNIQTKQDAIKLLNIALEHEWAVSFEYLIHAYSMPKGQFFYQDPILQNRTDIRAQTIQIGIDEMYHALQLGIIVTQLGGTPSFKTDEVMRFPLIMDNLRRDKHTEDMVTRLYQTAEFESDEFPKIKNMVWNISYDEVRHSSQFTAMMGALEAAEAEEAAMIQTSPEAEAREDVALIHDIMHLENVLMHQYLKYVILFSAHQDLTQRLFKNSIDHMRHWDKNSGILKKLGSVIRIENAERKAEGIEISRSLMPEAYPGEERRSALETLVPAEEKIIAGYERLIPLISDSESREELRKHLSLNREHVFTDGRLLDNALTILS